MLSDIPKYQSIVVGFDEYSRVVDDLLIRDRFELHM